MALRTKCPTCRKPVPWQGNPYRPFCSERCRLIDLGAWVDESYRIPGEQAEEVADGEEQAATANRPAPGPHAHPSDRTD